MKNAPSKNIGKSLDDNHKRIQETNDLLDRIEYRLKHHQPSPYSTSSPKKGHIEEAAKYPE